MNNPPSISSYPIGSNTNALPGIIPLSILGTTPQAHPAFNHLAKLAEQIIEDPIAMRRLSEQVIEMLTFELQQQHERGQRSNLW